MQLYRLTTGKKNIWSGAAPVGTLRKKKDKPINERICVTDVTPVERFGQIVFYEKKKNSKILHLNKDLHKAVHTTSE